MDEVLERLVRERSLSGKTVSEFCKELGISRQTYYNYLNGKTIPKVNLLPTKSRVREKKKLKFSHLSKRSQNMLLRIAVDMRLR